MSADPAVKSAAFPAALPRDPEPIRIRTLALLRWIAIAGQLAAVIVAHFMSIGFPVLPVLVLIAAAVAMNLWLSLRPFMRASPSHAIVQLGFDLMQNSALMALTGGMTNPFALLVLAPVTIAATSLNLRQTLALSLAAVALISVAAMVAIPLQDADGGVLRLAPILALGHWAALVIGVAFFAYYAHRVTAELSATSNALFATQMALAREQRLQHLGGVVAAAAHEMGTPLATIKLIASELVEELNDRPDLQQDARALRDSAERCGTILRSMGRAGKDDLHMRSAPLHAVLEDAAGPHADRGPQLDIIADGPEIHRDPAVIHALRNLIQNAVDFAQSRVVVEADQGARHLTITIRDDGPGYPPALLARIGDPYLTSRREGRQRGGYEGMGLGLFIAKALLERSGAVLTFANGGPGAIVTVRWPLDRIRADSRVALGDNPLLFD
ncbi:MAG: ActS/PrrB/RegB family redox-sensitive histidine kinase [Paracoccus sp. (in: a-proteobacteria)]|jgi:two-component system sensor histidine kinase RegB|uniref:ActS/PrrB/RegB family redox-sensitive histidine kinase n=1 Tax=unclassified Paracoccus (in: a-proteobacteria) TaxID=2688777 RepID=UPI000C6041D6|nr:MULTISPECIES: ActS/PrrB/RegB family redox-sensitive histidine kinase [unclassified Paracoccus (in: a-proteobacteria)]MAN56817.1 sensor histidine kinase [Paracoccus sp. (in: a-proteobacteria)]MBA48583.1 sensor histidine kinase [Paracoccus sp. (in: a-proteobacteria)]MCS5601421.1 ActS/PrrB/RegB family redox-sensitive histidine kinase [Paracoccus sp. (in: a-proteobacteria)]MDB2551547.1 ActS/PrrB/RegB family redox-sensitive histidine kinase [Paracoccus sp. (in: a-proteobacteria)]|tara:strand:- start:1321 stop:2646 length:1326 start_codon:yes stop_codon:yes gene_type:complete